METVTPSGRRQTCKNVANCFALVIFCDNITTNGRKEECEKEGGKWEKGELGCRMFEYLTFSIRQTDLGRRVRSGGPRRPLPRPEWFKWYRRACLLKKRPECRAQHEAQGTHASPWARQRPWASVRDLMTFVLGFRWMLTQRCFCVSEISRSWWMTVVASGGRQLSFRDTWLGNPQACSCGLGSTNPSPDLGRTHGALLAGSDTQRMDSEAERSNPPAQNQSWYNRSQYLRAVGLSSGLSPYAFATGLKWPWV